MVNKLKYAFYITASVVVLILGTLVSVIFLKKYNGVKYRDLKKKAKKLKKESKKHEKVIEDNDSFLDDNPPMREL